MASGLTIPILIRDAETIEWRERVAAAPDSHLFAGSEDWHEKFGPSGRWLIAAALAGQELKRTDEIAIVTTSDETYVSLCVSVTAFNFARISRVVTSATRVIILVHEFGLVLDDVTQRVADWKAAGITVFEDCAHLIGVTVDGAEIGTLGDVSFFSLPKIIPATSGGLMRSRTAVALPNMSPHEVRLTEDGKIAAQRYLLKIGYLNALRRRNADTIAACAPASLTRFLQGHKGLPWVYGLLHPAALKIKAAYPHVDWASTLRGDLLYLPTNPAVEPDSYADLFASEPFASLTAGK